MITLLKTKHMLLAICIGKRCFFVVLPYKSDKSLLYASVIYIFDASWPSDGGRDTHLCIAAAAKRPRLVVVAVAKQPWRAAVVFFY